MKKLITLLLLFIPFLLIAQDSYIKNRWNITMDMARKSDYTASYNDPEYRKFVFDSRIGVNYGIGNKFETGLYFGYSKYSAFRYIDGPPFGQIENTVRLSYGVNIKFQLAPFIMESNQSKVDLYLIGKLGGIYHPLKGYILGHPFVSLLKEHEHEFSLGPGLAFHFFKYVGFFTEVNWGRFQGIKTKHFEWRYGISIQF